MIRPMLSVSVFEPCGPGCRWGEDCTGHPAYMVEVPEPERAPDPDARIVYVSRGRFCKPWDMGPLIHPIDA